MRIVASTATGNKVIGNYIGTNVNGTADLGNNFSGVIIDAAPNNTVGGTTTGERNIISGNEEAGVFIVNPAATRNKVIGNYIGLDVTGTLDLGNTGSGVQISNSPNNIIGGATAGERNIISGNNGRGIDILNATATGNKVIGNFIGTDVTGMIDLGNTSVGVWINGATLNAIGGTTAGERNIISGNNDSGVLVQGNSNKISGNYIGTNASGTLALGNSSIGIQINAAGNTIGGTTADERNLISANENRGIDLGGSSAINNLIIGNYIGSDVTGAVDLGNFTYGISIDRASNNTIGGLTAAEGNLIFGNDNSGIGLFDLTGFPATSNKILRNSIYNNSRRGIDFYDDGVTANDSLDADTGPNNLQNFPVLSCVTSINGSTTIQGTLNSLATTSFRIEFFVNDACDASGNGEGQTFIGSSNVTTNGSGDATVNATFAQTIAAGKFITATATRLDSSNNPVETSEFSACRAVVTPTLTIGKRPSTKETLVRSMQFSP